MRYLFWVTCGPCSSALVFGLVYDAVKPRTQFIFKVVYNTFLLILLVTCFVPCFQSMVGKKMVTGVLKLPYTVVFAPFMYMLAEIIVRTCINIKNAFKEYKEGGKES